MNQLNVLNCVRSDWFNKIPIYTTSFAKFPSMNGERVVSLCETVWYMADFLWERPGSFDMQFKAVRTSTCVAKIDRIAGVKSSCSFSEAFGEFWALGTGEERAPLLPRWRSRSLIWLLRSLCVGVRCSILFSNGSSIETLRPKSASHRRRRR